METLESLSERLYRRFKSVPNLTEEDVVVWVEDAIIEHGYSIEQQIPPEIASLIQLYAEADGTAQIALRTAHYFSFTDKDEKIDKSMVPKQYQAQADALWARYRRKRDEGVEGFGGSVVRYMRRVDRP